MESGIGVEFQAPALRLGGSHVLTQFRYFASGNSAGWVSNVGCVVGLDTRGHLERNCQSGIVNSLRIACLAVIVRSPAGNGFPERTCPA